jgi:predicted dehydrogenase
MKKIKIGILGAGGFSSAFIPLFQAHPLVSDVYVAEMMPDRLAQAKKNFQVETTYTNLEDLLKSDAHAIAIFSQRWQHAPQAIAALRAEKHVYSAVPAAISIEELEQLIQAVKETGLTYMMGETSYYQPSTIYCRKRFTAGEMGRFVYAEGEYNHDMEHGFYGPYQGSNGADWKKYASFPPMLYPTHSCGMVLGVTGARMTSVSCLGYVDDHKDGIFNKELSHWGNNFSNETALYRTSDGGMVRINEFRRIGLKSPATGSVRCRIYGTNASYEEQANARAWITHDGQVEDLMEQLKCTPNYHPEKSHSIQIEGVQDDFFSSLAPVHDRERLPREFASLGNGHFGSHQFLVDDFLKACTSGDLPPVNVWTAARYCAPGIVAHESAMREGELLSIPDLGNPPD